MRKASVEKMMRIAGKDDVDGVKVWWFDR